MESMQFPASAAILLVLQVSKMMFRYLWTKPAGGGPAPLIHNPVRQWMIMLVFLHLLLFIVAGCACAFPSITDMHCGPLGDNVSYCFTCGAVAFCMFFYFSVLSCQTWGTERHWTAAAVVTLTMAFLDVLVSGWGLYVVVDASNGLFRTTEVEDGCDTWTAYAFYYGTAMIIGLHVIIALLCGAVSFRLTSGISSQLEELRRLV